LECLEGKNLLQNGLFSSVLVEKPLQNNVSGIFTWGDVSNKAAALSLNMNHFFLFYAEKKL